MNIDVLCFTGHKGLMGPQGTGGLCIRPGVELRPLLRGGTGIHSYDHEQPQAYPARLEAGTLNTHGIAGLHAALKFIEKQTVQAIGAHERALMQRFYDGVNDLDGVLKQFDEIIGIDRLYAIHINDSKNPFESHKDRHEKIGEGSIGTEAFERIINHPMLADKPFFLETPNELDGYAKEIALLKSLRRE